MDVFDDHTGQSDTSKTNVNAAQAVALVLGNQWVTIWDVFAVLDLSIRTGSGSGFSRMVANATH
jgi:uncharacterized protein YraI